MKKELTPQDALLEGIQTHHEQMDNGEKRFRLMATDGTGYCRTVLPSESVWQNSHYHRQAQELYIVQEGWLLFAELLPDGIQYRIYRAGEYFVTSPMTAHNLYAGDNTVLHTVKFGQTVPEDWFPSPELDRETKDLNVSDMKKLLQKFT